ncbi:unnamed protein product [Rhizophagus irregularis]|uniref:Uncharacterized protein n=1 Tax=Rhizophagus irregularis TaxID=588596 RepID=A0A915ZSS4_9GLOM|nr:unnamed protein product [Rhizophagus irregularis]CAB5386789.1 unnamed protein product [Rhizophagus irregularis]
MSRKNIHILASSFPIPKSTLISKSSIAKISLALSSLTFSGSPKFNKRKGVVPSVGINDTETLFGIIDETPAYPTAHNIRPQFASCPYKAVFTNEEVEMVDAICFASVYVFAPYVIL